jgi:hypothetical protein
MRKVASRGDWKTKPLPAQHKAILLDRCYTPEEFNQIKAGLIPECMEHHWFIFYEAPCLFLHRSWTGFCVYHVRFELSAGGFLVTEVLVNRNPQQYRETNDHPDALLLAILLDGQAGRDTRSVWQQYRATLGFDSAPI